MYIGVFVLIAAVFFAKKSLCLNCFVCHSRQNPDCGDPFLKNGNSSGSLALFECDRVKKVGESLIAASNAMGGMPPPYIPLEGATYVCYKITMEQHAVRGCAKPDFCTNMTEVCEVCIQDGCNGAPHRYPHSAHFILLLSCLARLYPS